MSLHYFKNKLLLLAGALLVLLACGIFTYEWFDHSLVFDKHKPAGFPGDICWIHVPESNSSVCVEVTAKSFSAGEHEGQIRSKCFKATVIRGTITNAPTGFKQPFTRTMNNCPAGNSYVWTGSSWVQFDNQTPESFNTCNAYFSDINGSACDSTNG